MKIYLSSLPLNLIEEYKKIKPESELNVFISYAYRNKEFKSILGDKRHLINSIVLDSGTFTKNMAKNTKLTSKITFEGFKVFASRFGHHFDFIFNYDDDFDDDGVYENVKRLNELREVGVNAVPVVHDYLNEHNEIERYLKDGHPIIALGYSKNRNRKNLKKATKTINDHGVDVHILGMSTLQGLKECQPEYCDSSNWVQSVRYGYMYFLDNNLKEIKIRFKDYTETNGGFPLLEEHPLKSEILQYVKDELGFKYTDLYGSSKNFVRSLINIHHFVKTQELLTNGLACGETES
jgi:hypothetical protein